MSISLIKALGIQAGETVAFVGAGGKTTAMFAVARELERRYPETPVIVTASTHLTEEQCSLADHHMMVTAVEDIQRFFEQPQSGVQLLTGTRADDGRMHGLPSDLLDIIYKNAHQADMPVLIEADGSRRLPLKAPAAHEPAIPAWVDRVVIMAGLSGIGRMLTTGNIHRPEIFARLGGGNENQPVLPDHLINVLTSPLGGLKNIPEQAAAVLYLNQVDTLSEHGWIDNAIPRLLKAYHRVVVGALNPVGKQAFISQVFTRIAGVILAAGGAQRFGSPKILLDWKGKPLIRHVAEVALRSGLFPVVVVLGSEVEAAVSILQDLPVEVVVNENWHNGQGSSVAAGVKALPAGTGALLFFPADLPQVSVDIVHALVDEYSRSMKDVIQPRVGGAPVNPVLFGEVTFPHLQKLNGREGGRGIFAQFPPETLMWEDQRLLMDIDTPEDYDRLKDME